MPSEPRANNGGSTRTTRKEKCRPRPSGGQHSMLLRGIKTLVCLSGSHVKSTQWREGSPRGTLRMDSTACFFQPLKRHLDHFRAVWVPGPSFLHCPVGTVGVGGVVRHNLETSTSTLYRTRERMGFPFLESRARAGFAPAPRLQSHASAP